MLPREYFIFSIYGEEMYLGWLGKGKGVSFSVLGNVSNFQDVLN